MQVQKQGEIQGQKQVEIQVQKQVLFSTWFCISPKKEWMIQWRPDLSCLNLSSRRGNNKQNENERTKHRIRHYQNNPMCPIQQVKQQWQENQH